MKILIDTKQPLDRETAIEALTTISGALKEHLTFQRDRKSLNDAQIIVEAMIRAYLPRECDVGVSAPISDVSRPLGGKAEKQSNFRSVQSLIAEECDRIKEMLLEKNRNYGNSALDPVRIFSKADPVEQINVRMDDKLSRLARGSDGGEDPEMDLAGYLILKRVAKRRQKR